MTWPLDWWYQKRVTVGGGCGFVGSYVVPRIVHAGANVTVVDNLENGELASLDPVCGAVEFVQGDLRDRQVCDRVFDGCDLFINLAAKASGVGFSRTHHGEMLVDNLLTGLLPLQMAVASRVQHIVITSTSCVYPDEVAVPTPELNPFTGTPESVNQGYGWAKRIQELAGSYFAREQGIQVTILRPFNIYGANYSWRSNERAHVIPSLVKRVLDGEDPLVVWGSGGQRRNFLHGTDAAEVIARVIERMPREPVNIGYEDDTSIAELVSLVCEITNHRPKVIFDRSKPDGAARKSADSTRLRALTDNYRPRVSLKQGIQEMVDWYERTFTAAH